MKFVIVVLNMRIDAKVAMKYLSCVVARNNNIIGLIRGEGDIEETIKRITENKELKNKNEKEVSFGGKIVNVIEIDVE